MTTCHRSRRVPTVRDGEKWAKATRLQGLRPVETLCGFHLLYLLNRLIALQKIRENFQIFPSPSLANSSITM